MANELPPANNLKVEPLNALQDSCLQKNQQQTNILQSPVTEPMLLPEMWGQVFEHLSPDELQTVINTTPEWNQLLHSQKTKILFPKVLACVIGKLFWKDILSLRMVSKACNAGVETAYPEIRGIVNLSKEREMVRENLRQAMDELRARVRLVMRNEALNEQRQAEGLPALEFREGEEVVPEDEFREEEIRAYLARRFPALPQILWEYAAKS